MCGPPLLLWGLVLLVLLVLGRNTCTDGLIGDDTQVLAVWAVKVADSPAMEVCPAKTHMNKEQVSVRMTEINRIEARS